jgi:hypothetical protein
VTIRRSRAIVALVLTVTLATAAPAAGARSRAVTHPRFAEQLARLDASANTDAFVHFAKDLPYETGIALVRGVGLTDVIELLSINAVYAFGPVEGFETLRLSPEVIFLEDAGTEPLNLETATWATRARTLYEVTGGIDLRVSAPNGDPLDGRSRPDGAARSCPCCGPHRKPGAGMHRIPGQARVNLPMAAVPDVNFPSLGF